MSRARIGGSRLSPGTAVEKFWFRKRTLSFVEPECIQPDDVIDPEIFVGVVALDVIVPDIVDLLPGDRQYRRVLLHDGFGLAHEILALAGIDLAVDLVDQRV